MNTRRVLVVHPAADLYGSDLQLVEAVRALGMAGATVKTELPESGPLHDYLHAAGASTDVRRFPVLRRSALSPRRVIPFAASLGPAVAAAADLLLRARPDVLLVNTLTIPWWILAGRIAGIRVVVYAHEAEAGRGRLVAAGLAAPLLAADRVIANSGATTRVLTADLPGLIDRVVTVPNGVPDTGEPAPLRERIPSDPMRCVVVGRLSPRKGTMVALEAVATLRARGIDTTLEVCGSVFPGYEWFESELRARKEKPDLAGSVRFHGYVSPTRPFLEDADVVLVPSFGESFGNVAAEGMLAARPVVASAGLGLSEVLMNAPKTGLLVPPGDPAALADAVETLAADPALARRIASAGRAEALARFSVERYRRDFARAVLDV
ncbi:glycosyltransferase family 4 protein [Actinomyces succiniciruminis]|uniref:Glycosyl transferase n=1 Tax=Actinomyces succiniciruminis TaxID=1522002 RepID=A0A1L7RQU6_9ACTO|nr:glycosyltransferase family 4 protein [Actinomyces succiniciruminis]CED92660.1 Glycosyl transferase [Actinomyces succiniciruminis]